MTDVNYHFGLLVDFTIGDIPSRYRDFVLLKFTMLNITLCHTTMVTYIVIIITTLYIHIYTVAHKKWKLHA